MTAELRPDPAPPKRDVVTKVCAAAPPVASAVESVRPAAELAVQLANHPHANSRTQARDTMPQPHDSRDIARKVSPPAKADHVPAHVKRAASHSC